MGLEPTTTGITIALARHNGVPSPFFWFFGLLGSPDFHLCGKSDDTLSSQSKTGEVEVMGWNRHYPCCRQHERYEWLTRQPDHQFAPQSIGARARGFDDLRPLGSFGLHERVELVGRHHKWIGALAGEI